MTLKRNQFGQYSTNRNYKLVTVTLDQESLQALESLKTLTGLRTNSSLIRHILKHYNNYATPWKVTDLEVDDYGKEENNRT